VCTSVTNRGVSHIKEHSVWYNIEVIRVRAKASASQLKERDIQGVELTKD